MSAKTAQFWLREHAVLFLVVMPVLVFCGIVFCLAYLRTSYDVQLQSSRVPATPRWIFSDRYVSPDGRPSYWADPVVFADQRGDFCVADPERNVVCIVTASRDEIASRAPMPVHIQADPTNPQYVFEIFCSKPPSLFVFVEAQPSTCYRAEVSEETIRISANRLHGDAAKMLRAAEEAARRDTPHGTIVRLDGEFASLLSGYFKWNDWREVVPRRVGSAEGGNS
jgi:hypothetical protein